MTEKGDRMVIHAKMDRIEELISEINGHMGAIDKKMETIDRLQAEIDDIEEEFDE